MKTLRLVLFAGLTAALSCLANSQVATGTPPFSSIAGGSFESIDLGNLNIHISIPIISRAGRGLPLNYSWNYDSSIWYPAGTAWTPVTNWGWRSETEAAVGYISYKAITIKCYDSQGFYWGTKYSNFFYNDSSGTGHGFSILYSDCSSDNSPHTGVATDGSGMYLDTDANTVTLTSGTVITAPAQTNTGSGTVKDSNGNYTSVTTTNITDTLGSTALSITGSPSPTQFSYTGPQNNTQNITIGYTGFNIKTNFGCSGIAEYNASNVSLVTSITLPDNTQYSIAYEPTPGNSGYYTGRIQSITLPTGATITYAYTGSNDGTSCVNGGTIGLKRQTPDTGSNSWQYTRTQVGNNWKTAISDPTSPTSNETDIIFNGIYELQRKIYTGAASGGTLLATIDICYNAATPDGSGTCLRSIACRY